MVRLARTILAAAALAAAGRYALRVLARSRAEVATPTPAPTPAPPAPTVGVASGHRDGTPEQRGHGGSVALDVDRLRTSGEGSLEPVVQYLTYIQSERDEHGHLMFVRYADLDAMADLEGTSTPDFLDRLDQLGVVVSNN